MRDPLGVPPQSHRSGPTLTTGTINTCSQNSYDQSRKVRQWVDSRRSRHSLQWPMRADSRPRVRELGIPLTDVTFPIRVRLSTAEDPKMGQAAPRVNILDLQAAEFLAPQSVVREGGEHRSVAKA